MKQIIISVGREFGSGGHIVAQKLAEHYDIPIFNKELLEEMARKEGYSEKALEKYDEKPVNFGFMPLPYAGGNIPIEQEIAMKQFEFIKNKADAGESFVIVGRCADEILAYNPNLVSVFITGDRESKIARVMDREGLDRKQAINKMKRMVKLERHIIIFIAEINGAIHVDMTFVLIQERQILIQQKIWLWSAWIS